MALPLAPIAGIALRYCAVALATYAIARKVPELRRNQASEDAMDDLDEGISFRKDSDQVNTAGRFKRTVRLGANGPGVEIDATALGRIKFKKV